MLVPSLPWGKIRKRKKKGEGGKEAERQGVDFSNCPSQQALARTIRPSSHGLREAGI